MPEFEYYEGTKVIQHEDGSTTHIYTSHEPYVEPLTKKQTAAVIGGIVAIYAGVLSLPYVLDRMEEWSAHRKEIRRIRREKKLAKVQSEPAE